MESLGPQFVCLILVVCFAVPSLAKDYTVGETGGWTLSGDYGTWASGKTFSVGDNLVFNYGSGHTVDEVSATDYNSCTVGNAISSDSSGATTIALKTPGTHYFICGVVGHCGSGMKLAVTVAGGAAAGPSSGTGTGTGAGTTTTTPATTTTTPATTKTPSRSIPDSSPSSVVSPSVAAVLLACVALFKSALL